MRCDGSRCTKSWLARFSCRSGMARIKIGQLFVDESLITGETAPRSVAPGALIHAGTVNLSSALVTQATATADFTPLRLLAESFYASQNSRVT